MSDTTDGALTVPSFRLPISPALSPQAQAAFIARQQRPTMALSQLAGPFATEDEYRQVVEEFRAQMASLHRALVRLERRSYAVEIEETTIGGVRVEIVTPSAGVPYGNQHRILINLHGGAFVGGAEAAGLVEAIPISAVFGVTIVCVDYRQAYEHRFPAASEDVASVFKALLGQHRADAIGIYGYSAGAMLTAQTVPWLASHHLPRPGAVALCSGGAGGSGDSLYLGPIAMGDPAPNMGQDAFGWRAGYLGDTDLDDARAVPLHSTAAMAGFPPTLLLSGTRSFDLSDVILTHRALQRAGVAAELQVWEGLWHCFPYNPLMPESQEAYDVLASFFDRSLAPR